MATAFYSVNTPTCFLEYELPDDTSEMTLEQWNQMVELEDAAERHFTHVQRNPYRIG